MTGGTADLIARAPPEEPEFARTIGLPIPTSVGDPNCINRLGLWLYTVIGIGVLLACDVRDWGLPPVMVAIIVAAYMLPTVFF